MGPEKGLGWTFDTVVEAYEKMRPEYPKELYEAIFAYIPVGESSRVVEVGPGSGQATLPFLQTGCRLTGVECGPRFSALCREKFRDFPGFSVITGRFEHTPLEEGAYDLVFSASAFHWVPEEIGYPKVFVLLKSGGAFARFAHHPFRGGDTALTEEIDRLYAAYYYPFYPDKKPEAVREYTAEQARQRALTAEAYGFEEIRYALFYRTRRFSAKEYVRLLGTYSDHIALDEPVRAEFFAKIEDAIDRHGGIPLRDTMDLQLARKP